ncbi:septal ring lytic transglycosylase RlpA family protein [Flavihumibacter sp. RY-1]|uniref:Probable endolytic peptidoglycan transglycosylase RlpA n=1 Tax=Flavihumibacter fluminis TaxID=2909236 RepID=A0ABS9BFL0_9BACT|nr:septal ring lytic transglycosylase RlpA family protein [Flavihumibacter fluminis]MCF1713619.1 septal ring lytic transglycosylase RlpA family protein [Flavihumibacter fluminis]
MTIKTVLSILGLLFLLCSVASFAQDSTQLPAKKRIVNLDSVQYGVASYYAAKFQGRLTASGEKYDSSKLTAAHNGLPFGTWVRVTNRRNKRSVIVKINDRLHHANTRVVDLSATAAKKLGFYSRGLTKVKVEVLGKKKPIEQ